MGINRNRGQRPIFIGLAVLSLFVAPIEGFCAGPSLAATVEQIPKGLGGVVQFRKEDIARFIEAVHQVPEKEALEALRNDIDDNFSTPSLVARDRYTAFLSSAVEQFPDELATKYALAYLYLRENNVTASEALLNEIGNKRPDFPYLKRSLAYIYQHTQRWDQSLALYEEVARHIDENPPETRTRVFIHLGDLYRIKKNYPKSLESYQKAFAMDPTDYELAAIYGGFGDVYSDQGEFKECIVNYDQAIANAPQVPFFYEYASYCYQQLKQWPEAVGTAEKAVSLKKYPAGHYTLGNAYRGNGQLDKAAEQYRAVIALMPKAQPVWYALGLTYEEMKDYKSAREAFLKADELKPNDAATNQELEKLRTLLSQ